MRNSVGDYDLRRTNITNGSQGMQFYTKRKLSQYFNL